MAFAQLPLNSRDYPQDFDFDFYTPNFPLVLHLARSRAPLHPRDCSTYPFFSIDRLIANQQKELCFLGLVSMGSRVYKTIPSAIERCKLANIRIIMVSQVQPPVRAASPWRPTNSSSKQPPNAQRTTAHAPGPRPGGEGGGAEDGSHYQGDAGGYRQEGGGDGR